MSVIYPKDLIIALFYLMREHSFIGNTLLISFVIVLAYVTESCNRSYSLVSSASIAVQ